ncbi:MAG: tryptophan synthase subunit alpha [Saprospiraceae bacterium]
MSRITSLFNRKRQDILNIYFTAGHPTLESTGNIIRELDRAGVDLIEVGIPYSDPLADGPTIQASSQQALANGMTLPTLLDQIREVRPDTDVPLVLMGYLNQVMQYGAERFFRDARTAGVDGLILPDLPLVEFDRTYRELLQKAGLDIAFLVTPQTPPERIRQLDAASSGFLYLVSSSAITGGNSAFGDEQISYFTRLADMDLRNPRLIGFGIADHAGYATACQYANGAIVGSAFIRALDGGQPPGQVIPAFVQHIRSHQPATSSEYSKRSTSAS